MNRSRMIVFVSLFCMVGAAVVMTSGDLTGVGAAASTFSKEIAPIFAKNLSRRAFGGSALGAEVRFRMAGLLLPEEADQNSEGNEDRNRRAL